MIHSLGKRFVEQIQVRIGNFHQRREHCDRSDVSNSALQRNRTVADGHENYQ